MFGWDEPTFWRTTPAAYLAAVAQYNRANDPDAAREDDFETFKDQVIAAQGERLRG